MLAQACGAAVMILAPGNFARASSYVYDSMAVEIAARLARITLYTVVYAGVLLAALMLVHALGRAMNVNMRTMRALWFAAAALLCAYAMAASAPPHSFPRRKPLQASKSRASRLKKDSSLYAPETTKRPVPVSSCWYILLRKTIRQNISIPQYIIRMPSD